MIFLTLQSKGLIFQVDRQTSEQNRHKNRCGFKNPKIRPSKYKGIVEDLKVHIYYISTAWKVNIYANNTKDMVEYIRKSYRHGSNARKLTKTLDPMSIPLTNKYENFSWFFCMGVCTRMHLLYVIWIGVYIFQCICSIIQYDFLVYCVLGLLSDL